MPKSDKICYIDKNGRGFYNFQYGIEFPYFLCSLAGLISGTGAFMIVLLVGNFNDTAFIITLIAGNGGAFVFGMLVTSSLFFFHVPKIIKTTFYSIYLFNLYFFGLVFATGFGTNAGLPLNIMGVVLLALGTIIVYIFFKKYGRVGVYTDGVKIGDISFKYKDIIKVSYGTGPIEKKIPEEGKEKELEILTPIEYEYVGKDFGIFHVYMFVVTADKLYIAQSLNRQSNMAQDTLNAWARYIEARKQKED